MASFFFIGRGHSGRGIRWAIYGVIVICGGARSFLLPARNALGADLVPRPLYPSAVAWRTGADGSPDRRKRSSALAKSARRSSGFFAASMSACVT